MRQGARVRKQALPHVAFHPIIAEDFATVEGGGECRVAYFPSLYVNVEPSFEQVRSR